ncbi:DUF5799 family protein [Halonotius roseus]|uniref:Uncharacterized protein n=1 Tax=Halonotius roseus TaxID=2511997 RepID=A0A544QQL4_9EURY|nr:DUF5799 family protein [Halonotius roseus]TQQ81726.1 hypothetical protein EWF95_01960 [Halonotius roseus]
MSEWRDMLVGDRMAVDQAFTDRVQGSAFTNQEWGLIMTATELDIEHAADPEAARLVADTEAVESIMPELAAIRSRSGPMAGGADEGANDPGIIDSIKGALGFSNDDDGVDPERLAAAESLAQEYADELQQHLEANDGFEAVREAYVESAER